MKALTALIISIASTTVAVGIVSLDLVFTMTSSIDVRENGSWETAQSYPFAETSSRPHTPVGPGCLPNDLRIRIDNDRPIPATVDVLVWYSSDKTSGAVTLFEETWSLAAFEERVHEFKVPDAAFPTSTTANPNPYVSVDALLGGPYGLNVCVAPGGPQ